MEDRCKNHTAELLRFIALVGEHKHPTHASPTGITFITDDGLETFSYELLCEFVTRNTIRALDDDIKFRLRQKGLYI